MPILDVLSNFPAPSWRGIPFPLSSLENGFTHDHVEHKWIYRDGMHIEATGRNGFNFNARIPFNNGVQPAHMDAWAGQVLYPGLFRKFLNACLDRSSGEFIHPDFGPIQCKARDVTWRYMASPRDGAELSVRFYQSTDDDAEDNGLLAAEAPMATAVATADRLDQEVAAAGPLPEIENDNKSFAEMMLDVLSGKSGTSAITAKLDHVADSLTRLDDVFYWPLRGSTEDMRAAVIDLGPAPTVQRSGKIRQYTVPFGTSLPTIASRLSVRTDDLVRLNPKLARDPYVREGTQVLYF